MLCISWVSPPSPGQFWGGCKCHSMGTAISWQPTSHCFSHVFKRLYQGFSVGWKNHMFRRILITVEMPSRIVDSMGATPQLDIRLAMTWLLVFSTFLRYDELARLYCCEIQFEASHCHTCLSKSPLAKETSTARVTVIVAISNRSAKIINELGDTELRVNVLKTSSQSRVDKLKTSRQDQARWVAPTIIDDCLFKDVKATLGKPKAAGLQETALQPPWSQIRRRHSSNQCVCLRSSF